MAWAMVGAAAISAIGGWLSSKNASDSADRATDLQGQAMMEQVNLGREQLAFGQQQYADWKGMFDPMYAKMLSEMDQGLTPNYGMIAGDVSSAFQSARGQELRDMRRYGINPLQGGYRNMSRQYGINEAAAKVGAFSQAREGVKGEKYNRMQNATNMLVGMQGTPANLVSSGYGNTMNALGNQAAMYGGQSQMYLNRGAAEAYGWGQLGGAMSGIDWGGIWGDVKGWFGNNNSGGGRVPGY